MRFIFNFSWGGRPPIETEDESIVMEDECGVDKILDDDEPIETKDDSSLSTAAIEPTTTTTTSTTTLSNHDDTQGNNNIILDAVGNFARSAASTLGHRLKFTKILSAIDTINKSSSVGLNSISQEEEEGRIKLPRVVVIGDESAGKSSTLERVAMAGVLPPKREHLHQGTHCFEASEGHAIPLPETRFETYHSFPDNDDDKNDDNDNDNGEVLQVIEGLTPSQVRQHIEDHMKMIADTKTGIVIDKEIQVEVRSAGVPNIDLVDLPGLVAVKAGYNTKLSELTEDCTREYLKKESTGAVVCVIDAGMVGLRASNTIKLLQDAPEQVKNHAIGVFAKADKAEDRDWEDIEDAEGNVKQGPFWRLEERIQEWIEI
eukprot:CAMPEP_0118695108 /NCGR_PEP_ID=MMETSP0800-20121206/12974_1 /TAXON_ID=210618 ORGANISM="Striatella unipunctata, Strain CCMP2910" /NCGR_SAMPLE_ID=MMETSP0800 /ASSEMBLY_ACC=CAM_ASM_000638 /LENGTH=372 /DNA_ID=CAMNT_0006593805 /DNA_START=241 /DNA_END=1358 /DNA_ORIENTATION=+